MHVTNYELKNKLPVFHIETESYPSFTALLMVEAGSFFETARNNGVAHFFEHMCFKGTKKYPSTMAIASILEGLGASYNAYTSKDHTGYYIKAPVESFDTVLDVLSEMLLSSKLDPKEIEREKGVILEEMNMYEDSPSRKVGDLFEETLFANTPLAMDVIGTKKSVSAMSEETIRQYMADWYKPHNSVLAIAGGFKGSKFEHSWKEVVADKFEKWVDGEIPKHPIMKIDQAEARSIVKTKKTEQAHFSVGFRTVSYSDERRHAVTVLSAILGGGMASRLFSEVRERRGLCYYISTGRDFFYDTGYLVTQAGVPNNAAKFQEALDVTLAQHKDIMSGNISDEEIQRVKSMSKGRLILSLEDSQSVASFYAIRKLFNIEGADPMDALAKIEAVTKDQVVEIARTCFTPDRFGFAAIGNLKASDLTLKWEA